MRVLVGLGNPGDEYKYTRHNVGFLLLRLMAHAQNVTWKKGFDGEIAEVQLDGVKALLFLPMQFMNNSGQSLRKLVDFYKLETTDICVVTDDVYIKPGSARIRLSGGDGGHNGLKSIHDHVGTDYWRVRLGVGLYEQEPEKREHQPALDAYVLQKLPAHDLKRTEALIDELLPNLVEWLCSGEGLETKTLHAA